MSRLILPVLAALLAVFLASLAAADDCGGTPCSADPPTTPAPTIVPVPWAPVSPLLLLPDVRK